MFSLFEIVTSRELVLFIKWACVLEMCWKAGAQKTLVEQPGGKREEGLAEFWLILVRAPAGIKKWITIRGRSCSNSASKWPRESLRMRAVLPCICLGRYW